MIQKESVELISSVEWMVVEGPKTTTNDAIPHTWIDMGYGYAECVSCHTLNKK